MSDKTLEGECLPACQDSLPPWTGGFSKQSQVFLASCLGQALTVTYKILLHAALETLPTPPSTISWHLLTHSSRIGLTLTLDTRHLF